MPQKSQTPTIKLGDPVPEFSLQATDGRQVSLADFRGRSAVSVVFLRHTW